MSIGFGGRNLVPVLFRSLRWSTGRPARKSPNRNMRQLINPLWTSALNMETGSGEGEAEDKSPNKEKQQKRHRDAEKEPLPEWPDGVNPHTGEKGGPKGPEPTRYGDWERKGRVTDF